jgi:putative heme iron utilization protein
MKIWVQQKVSFNSKLCRGCFDQMYQISRHMHHVIVAPKQTPTGTWSALAKAFRIDGE